MKKKGAREPRSNRLKKNARPVRCVSCGRWVWIPNDLLRALGRACPKCGEPLSSSYEA